MQAYFLTYPALENKSPAAFAIAGIKLLSVNDFIVRNLWIYHVFVAILIVLIVLFLVRLSSLNRKKKFIDNLTKKQGPLGPRNILNTLIDTLPDFIYIKDLESRFILANRKLARTVGKENGEQLIGKTDHDFYPKKLADEFRRNEIEVMTTGDSIINQLEKGLDDHRNDIWVSSTKMPLRDEDGSVIGIVGIGRDVTEWKKAQEELEKKTYALHEANSLLEERQEEILQQQEELRTQSERVMEEKNQLRTLIDSMPDRIYIKDRKSRFIIGNAHVAETMGAKNPEELVGKTDFDYFEKTLAEEYYRDEQKVMNERKPIINKEEKGLAPGGKNVIVSTTKVPVYDENRNVVGIVGIGRDITQQKEYEAKLLEKSENLQEVNVLLEERQEEIQQQSEELQTQAEHLISVNRELEKLSLVASKTDNVIVIMDREGNFEWVNEGFRKSFRMNLDEFISKRGRNIRQISHYGKINELIDKILNTKEPAIYESKTTGPDDQPVWFQTTISPVLDDQGAITRLISIDSDITEIKSAEQQINFQKAELEKNRDELKKLNATKDKFFSIIAHDLKNPFHSIMGFSDLLVRSYDSIEENKKIEFINLIKESSASAYTLLENLLHWARSQTNKIKYDPARINLTEIINENYQMVRANAEIKNISLIPPEKDGVTVFADYNLVNTIIRNLLSNAVKFTPDGGRINISLDRKDTRTLVSVKDSGVGMSDEVIRKLFRLDEFHTTTGTDGETGTGLGLIVCREFVRKHGGDLRVESEPGKGTTFTFDLPSTKN